jgi:N utilization substance protein A
MDTLDVDEVVGQLLASEGFANGRGIAYIELEDLASIEGFDDDTATELQTRAREYLARIEGEQDEERKALGVADELKEIPGITTAALVALGKADIRTIEDFAGLVPDDLVGYVERKDGETSRTAGALDGFDTSRAEAEAMIMQARLKAGWITQEDLDRATAGEEEEIDDEAAGEPAAPTV